MNVTQRRMEIFNLLQKNDTVEVSVLARRFDVSTMTIRRDLQKFERQGLVNITYGSAYLKKEALHEPSFAAKSNYLTEQKQDIGNAASRFVQDDETIIVDCGTTLLQLLKYLTGKHVTVITNSCPAISFANTNPKLKLILAPGEYNERSAGVFGNLTSEFFNRLHVGKVFMGAHGFSIEHGATEPDIETNAKRSMINAGEKKFLLADATKFDRTYLMQYAQLDAFDHIITDDSMDPACRARLEKACRDVVYAGKSADLRG